MKKVLLTFAIIFICGLFGSQSAQAMTDIYARPALYLGGSLVKDNQMNKDAKLVTTDKPLEISKADSYFQKDNIFYFKTGYFLLIASEKNLLSTMLFYNAINNGIKDEILQIKTKPEDKNVVGYSNGIWIIAIRQSIGLKEGENNITLKLDSSDVIKESNEQNNIYKFKVTLKS